MRSILFSAVVIVVSAAGVTAQVGRETKSAEAEPATKAEAIAFIDQLCSRLASPDARLRFAVREALSVMGNQCVGALKEQVGKEKDPHVQAFIKRTLDRIKKMSGKKRAMMMGGRDLDRMAMSTNLTLEQISKLEPIFAKHDKNVKSLWAEFKESEGFKDPGGYKDLMAEVKLLAEEAEPELDKFLDDKQRKYVKQQMQRSSPFGTGSRVSFATDLGGGGGGVVILGGPGGASPEKK